MGNFGLNRFCLLEAKALIGRSLGLEAGCEDLGQASCSDLRLKRGIVLSRRVFESLTSGTLAALILFACCRMTGLSGCVEGRQVTTIA